MEEIKTFCYRNREANNLKETKAGTKSIKKKMIISAAGVMLALIAAFGVAGFAGESGVYVNADSITGTADDGADGSETYTADNGADVSESYTADNGVDVSETYTADNGADVSESYAADNGADTSERYTADAGENQKDKEAYIIAQLHRQKLTRIVFNERPCIRGEKFLCAGFTLGVKGGELSLLNEDNSDYDASENYIPVMTGKEPGESRQEEPVQEEPVQEEPVQEEPKTTAPADAPDTLMYTYNEDMCKKLSDREYEILCRIVEAEAGDQDIYGEMLVANVIINRMNDPHFPDTVEEVVFQKIGDSYQFSPTNDGRYYTVEVSEQTVLAVDRVLAGEDYSSGSEYFFQRSLTSEKNSTWFEKNLDFVVKYGCHEFYREK